MSIEKKTDKEIMQELIEANIQFTIIQICDRPEGLKKAQEIERLKEEILRRMKGDL